MATNLTPLVTLGESRKVEPEVGDLITVELFGGKRSGARLERIAHGTYFVKLVGLEVPEPYQIGQRLPLNRQAVVDW